MASAVLVRAWWLGLLVALGACGGGDEPSAATVTMPVTQGKLVATGRSLDVAIVGTGLFAMTDSQGLPVFSRAGRLDVDAQGRLVNDEGWRLGGIASDSDVFDGVPSLPPLTYDLPGAASSWLRIEANLDARASAVTANTAFSANDPATYNWATALTVYDTAGRRAYLALYFIKIGTDHFVVRASNGVTVLSNPVAELVFTSSGTGLDWVASRAFPIDLPPPPDSELQPITGLQLDWRGMTTNGSNFTVSFPTTDGYPPGRLNQVEVAQDGRVTARYDNGQDRPAGQLLLARFALGDELQRVGRNGLRCASRCAAPIIAAPGEMLLGQLSPGALEELP